MICKKKNAASHSSNAFACQDLVVEMNFALGDFDDTVIAAMEEKDLSSTTSPDARGYEPVLDSEGHEEPQSKCLKPLIQPIDVEGSL